jgi:hypothetical protein
MTKPVQPASPSASTGEGKSFLERMQRGMANDPNANPEKAKMFAEKLEKYVNEGKALNEARNEHKKVPGLSRAGGGAGGDFSGMKGLDKPFKKGGKVKKFNDGGMSLEEKYPGAKITRAGPQPPPVEDGKGSEKHIRNLEALRYIRGNANAKTELFEEPKTKSKGTSGGGGGIPKVGPKRPLEMKAGGKVSSASKRADGCAIKGKTRGRMV